MALEAQVEHDLPQQDPSDMRTICTALSYLNSSISLSIIDFDVVWDRDGDAGGRVQQESSGSWFLEGQQKTRARGRLSHFTESCSASLLLERETF